MEALLTPDEESPKRETPTAMGVTHLSTTNHTYHDPLANQARFTDRQSDEIAQGWILNHGTTKISEEFLNFNPEWLSRHGFMLWRAALSVEKDGQNANPVTIPDRIEEQGLLNQFNCKPDIIKLALDRNLDTWGVAESALHKLQKLYEIREDARIGKGLLEGALTRDDACEQLNAVIEASRGQITPIDNEVPTPVLAQEALYGIAGQIVRKIEPESEAHPAALLVQLLVGMGSIVGRDPFFLTEADKQRTNLFAVIVGESSSGGKGTSWSRIRCILEHVDPIWFGTRMLKGLGSGESIISFLKDEEGDAPKDKRLFVREGEFATVLQVMGRQSCILGSILRDAWDSEDLQNHCKDQSIRASAPHASLLAHITPTELREKLTNNDAANGFLNRILLVHSARTKSLPNGGKDLHWDDEIATLQGIKEFAHGIGAIRRSHEANELWCSFYDELKENIPSGLWGKAVTRGCAQVVRLSMIYALMDLSETVEAGHLRAAKAVWDYCHASARWALEENRFSKDALSIYAALSTGAKDRTHIVKNVFSGKRTHRQIDAVLKELSEEIDVVILATGGAPKTVYQLKKEVG
jgi:hypothetical protein